MEVVHMSENAYSNSKSADHSRIDYQRIRVRRDFVSAASNLTAISAFLSVASVEANAAHAACL